LLDIQLAYPNHRNLQVSHLERDASHVMANIVALQ